MKKRVYLLQFSLLAGLIGFYLGCNKTDHPFGVDAPVGLDIPTSTPTPRFGSIDVYVFDNTVPMQGVTVNLVDPSGNTIGATATQSGVGYAAFNLSNLFNGIWTAIVPSQSISFVLNPGASAVTYKRTYDYCTLPITVGGGGQYAVSFTTDTNSVSIGPIFQSFNGTAPEFFPVTVSYYQTGNLNVPANVLIQGFPIVYGLYTSNQLNAIMGQHNGIFSYPITIEKTACFTSPKAVTLSVSATDFSGNNLQTSSPVSLSRNIPISVNLLSMKQSVGPGQNVVVELETDNDCGASWNTLVTGSGGTLSGTVTFFNGTLSNNGQNTYYTTNLSSFTVSMSVSNAVFGSYSASFAIATAAFGTFNGFGSTNW